MFVSLWKLYLRMRITLTSSARAWVRAVNCVQEEQLLHEAMAVCPQDTAGAVADKPLEELEREISCAVCHSHYDRPKLLPCNHYYCAACIENLATHARGKPFECPECRRSTTLPAGGVAELDGAFFVERMKDLYGKMARVEGKVEAACEQCGEGTSVAFCRQCTEFICEDCARCHKKMKSFSSHEVTTLADLREGGSREIILKEAPLPKCLEHDDVMKVFCFDCNRLICRDCVLYDHREHKSDFVKKGAAESRKKLLDSFAPLQSTQGDIANAEKAILLEKHVIVSQNEAVCSEIQQSFDKLKGILDQRQKDLVRKANKVAQGKIEALTGQVKGLQMAQTEIQSILEFVEKSVTIASDQDLMGIRTQLQGKLEEEGEHYSKLSLPPAAVGDLVYKAPPLDAIPKELGAVFTNKCASSVTFEPPTESNVGEPTHFFFELPEELGSRVQIELRSLVDTNCIVKGSVGFLDNACVVTYTPRVRGRHNLVVRVDGVDVGGSPFSIFVKIHPTQLGKPVRIIGGFNRPWGIAINQNQQLVVAESGAKKVTVVERNGKRVHEIGCAKFESPKGVAIGPNGAMYVTDNRAKCVFKFGEDGRQYICVRSFNSPIFVKVINSQVFVSDKQDHRIVVMNMECETLGFIASTNCHSTKDIAEHNGDLFVGSDGSKNVFVFQCKPEGALLRQVPSAYPMLYTRGSCFDKSGYLYVVSPSPSEGVYAYNSSGECVASFGLKTFDLLQDPAGLVIDDDGFVYVCDFTTEGKVYVF